MPHPEPPAAETGAEALVRTLIGAGVDTCFANPGTSEMHFVAALDRIPGIRCVLGLQENVVTGMADGYFRVTRRPAATLLHCGPGYANGIANLHNARRAGSGILNIVGDHAVPHVMHDSPLTADVDALVGATSDWHVFGTEPARIGTDAARGRGRRVRPWPRGEPRSAGRRLVGLWRALRRATCPRRAPPARSGRHRSRGEGA